MPTTNLNIGRFSVVSRNSFQDVLAAIEDQVGHPDMQKFVADVAAAKTDDELNEIVRTAVGPTDLMECMRIDQGAVLRLELGDNAPRVLRLLIGNPLTMRNMVKFVHDAGSYAPVTILLDERPDGVHISYDTMTSLLAPYGSAEVFQVAEQFVTH